MEKLGSLPSGGQFSRAGRRKTEKKDKPGGIFRSILDSESAVETAYAVSSVRGKADEDSGLEDLLDDIHQQGENLAREPGMASIAAYKNAVKNFINYIVSRNLVIEEIEGAKFNKFKPSVRQKRYTLISVIDEKLEKLAAGILLNQGKQFDILARVEEINGLLVDLLG